MKSLLKWLGISILFLALMSLLFVHLSNREERLALQVAQAEAGRVLTTAAVRAKLNIPGGTSLESEVPFDTNLYGRNWNFWFSLKPKGALVIWVYAPRGIWFVPLLNSRSSLALGEIEYSP